MKKMLMMCAVVVGLVAHTEPTITGVKAQQRYPWNGLVDIVVTLEGSAEEVDAVGCFFVATNSATGAAIPIASITRKGSDTGSGTIWARRFVWDVDKDVGEMKIEDVALTVDEKVLGGVQLWENGPYWAECNVGASKPEEYGYYFWWGDTVGYKRNVIGKGWISVKDGSSFSFKSHNCPTYGMSNSQLQSAGYIDSTGNLAAAHDAATAHIGAPWRMPTISECSALWDNCDTTWTTRGGVYGRLITGRGAYASKSLFLPAAGYGSDSSLNDTGTYGFYWSSTPEFDNAYGAWYMYFISAGIYRYDGSRVDGQSVRPLRGFSNGAKSDLKSGGGVTTHLKLDCRMGTRTAAKTEVITYSTEWVEGAGEGAVAVVSLNGDVISEKSGSGTVEWTPKSYGTNTLTHQVMVGGAPVGEVLSAKFVKDPLPEGGPYTETVDGIEWTFMVNANLEASLGMSSSMSGQPAISPETEGDIVIPEVLGGRFVTGTASGAFGRCTNLTGVAISPRITQIGSYAFYDCVKISSVTIPVTVTNIGTLAFCNCASLGDGVVIIDNCVLTVNGSCPSTIGLPEGVRLIAGGAFFDRSDLETITVPTSVTHIGSETFSYCTNLSSVVLLSPLTSIETMTFSGCSALTHINLPESVTSIGYGAFEDCRSIKRMELPSNVRHIGSAAFSGCTNLISIVIPEGVTTINPLLFGGCSSLAKVTLPSSIGSIGYSAFSDCINLTDVVIPQGVTNIGAVAFWSCCGLAHMTIPASVIHVGEGMFLNCLNLNAVDFEGAPPEDVSIANIKQDAAIRYNVKYFDKWQPVIEQCGWTNAKPYNPNPGFMLFLR